MDEHLPELLRIAAVFSHGDAVAARQAVEHYRRRVIHDVDTVLGPPRAVAATTVAATTVAATTHVAPRSIV